MSVRLRLRMGMSGGLRRMLSAGQSRGSAIGEGVGKLPTIVSKRGRPLVGAELAPLLERLDSARRKLAAHDHIAREVA